MIKKVNFKYHNLTNICLSFFLEKGTLKNYFSDLIKNINFSGEIFYPYYLKKNRYHWNGWFYTDLRKKKKKNKIKYTLNYNTLLFTKEYIFLVKFFQFFRRFNFDFKIIYYLLDSKYNYLWDIIILSNKKKLYYQFLLNIIKEYKKLWIFFNNSKIINYPSSYLVNFSSKYTSSSLLEQNFSVNNIFLLQKKINKSIKPVTKLRTSVFSWPHTSNFHKAWIKLSGFDYSLNLYTIHFLRVQRRYNKRRYSKVRVYSRPSFFGGICLGSIFISCFWGGTIKSVDWFITSPIIVDMNLILTFIFLLTIIRCFITDFSVSSLHNFAKIRIYRFLKLILSNKIIQKVFKVK